CGQNSRRDAPARRWSGTAGRIPASSPRSRECRYTGPSWNRGCRSRCSRMIKNITPLVLGTPWRNLTFLKVETDEGLVGISEGRNVNRTEALLGYLEGAKKRYVV